MPAVFVALSDRRIASLIDASRQRVVLAVPAIRKRTAEALVRAIGRLRQENVAVVTDCAEEVFRLGYGELEALLKLRESGCPVRQAAGLRIGLLICDDLGWVFAPTALYVAAEVHSDETPNAIALDGSAVHHIASRVIGTSESEAGGAGAAGNRDSTNGIEIGVEEVSDLEVGRAQHALEQAPPIPFDIARQVRVFEPYIQYVEISLRGCAIQRYRLEVPKSIQGMGSAPDVSSRLRTTFELIERDSEISSKRLDGELNMIRDLFTRSLGKPWGRVMLRASRALFDERIAHFRERLDEHRTGVEKSLEKHLTESRRQLVDYYLPIAVRTPPDALVGQTVGKPSEDQVSKWLDAELSRVFPSGESLVQGMTLDVQFRDVTYETLNEDGFGEKLRAAFPYVDWDKPFEEFDAARARDDARRKVASPGS